MRTTPTGRILKLAPQASAEPESQSRPREQPSETGIIAEVLPQTGLLSIRTDDGFTVAENIGEFCPLVGEELSGPLSQLGMIRVRNPIADEFVLLVRAVHASEEDMRERMSRR